MIRDPFDAVARFDKLPDDAIIGPKPTAIILNTTDHHLRRDPPIARRQISERNVGFRVGNIPALVRGTAQAREVGQEVKILLQTRRTAMVAEKMREIDHLKKKSVTAEANSLFDLKRDSVEAIAAAVVAPGRAESIARGILKRIGKEGLARAG